MASQPNVDPQEIEKFNQAARTWWDPKGPMGTLHTINPLRVAFVLQQTQGLQASQGLQQPQGQHRSQGRLKVLDVGCGGGVLAEALAQAGAQVTGIDLSPAVIAAAREHARARGVAVDYRVASAEEIAAAQPAAFDVVTCMEMLEHVPDPRRIVAACARALRPGGHAFFSTIHRSPKSFLFIIVGGEYLLQLLPRGTHRYRRLIRPDELKTWGGAHGLAVLRTASLYYNLLTRRFRMVPGRTDVQYMVHFVREK